MRRGGVAVVWLLFLAVPCGASADHGTQGGAGLPVAVSKGAPGSGGWFLSITVDDELRVGTYRNGGDLQSDWVSNAAPFGSYGAVRALAMREMEAVPEVGVARCDGYAPDAIVVAISEQTAEALVGYCPHAPTVAARDRVATVLRALVPE